MWWNRFQLSRLAGLGEVNARQRQKRDVGGPSSLPERCLGKEPVAQGTIEAVIVQDGSLSEADGDVSGGRIKCDGGGETGGRK
jgi:hypothetical protein